ncbi:MAG: monovalent cation/H(+) antiporter subunit G [Pseudomonadota bacterium]
MLEQIALVAAGLLVLVGAFFGVFAALGLWRLPDIYTRMHSASKAGTLGSGLLLIAIAVHDGETSTILRASAGVIFFLLTAPISAHLLAKAAYSVGYRLDPNSVRDEMKS